MSNRLKSVAVSAGAAFTVATWAQVPAQVLRRLDATTTGLRHAHCLATVDVTREHGGDSTTTTYAWSCSGRKLSLRTKPGSALQDRSQSVWNGRYGFVRTWKAGLPSGAPASSIIITAASPVWIDPLRFAYGINVQGASGGRGWLADVLRHVEVKLSSNKDGKVVLTIPSAYRYGLRRIELNSRWDYMTDLDQEYAPGRGFLDEGRSKLYLMNERRILAAQKVGAVWLPTKIQMLSYLGVRPSTNPGLKTTITLRDVGTNLDPAEFQPLSKAERKIAQRTGVALPHAHSPRHARHTDRQEASAGPPVMTQSVLGVGALAVTGGVIALMLRGRRRTEGYWGPGAPRQR